MRLHGRKPTSSLAASEGTRRKKRFNRYGIAVVGAVALGLIAPSAAQAATENWLTRGQLRPGQIASSSQFVTVGGEARGYSGYKMTMLAGPGMPYSTPYTASSTGTQVANLTIARQSTKLHCKWDGNTGSGTLATTCTRNY